MKKLILLSTVILLVACNNIFDTTEGDPKWQLLQSFYSVDFCENAEMTRTEYTDSNGCPHINIKVHENLVLIAEIDIYTKTGSDYDWLTLIWDL